MFTVEVENFKGVPFMMFDHQDLFTLMHMFAFDVQELPCVCILVEMGESLASALSTCRNTRTSTLLVTIRFKFYFLLNLCLEALIIPVGTSYFVFDPQLYLKTGLMEAFHTLSIHCV